MKDLYNKVLVKRAISAVTQTNSDTAIVSQIIDRQGFESVLFVISTGGLTDADATFTVLLEEGDNSALSDNTAVADADLLGTELLAGFQYDDDNEVRKLGYLGVKRYLRLTITPSGNNSGAAPICAMALLGRPSMAPVTQSAS